MFSGFIHDGRCIFLWFSYFKDKLKSKHIAYKIAPRWFWVWATVVYTIFKYVKLGVIIHLWEIEKCRLELILFKLYQLNFIYVNIST